MSLRLNLRVSPFGRGSLTLVCAGLAVPQLVALASDPADAEPPRESKVPDSKAAGLDDPGFWRWLTEVKSEPAQSGGMPLSTTRLPEGVRIRNIIPGRGQKQHSVWGARLRGKTIVEVSQEIDRIVARKPLHPFYSVRGDEPIGKVSWLHLSTHKGRTEQPPRELDVCGENAIQWICDSGNGVQALTDRGSQHALLNSRVQYLYAHTGAALSWQLGRTHAVAWEPGSETCLTADLPEPIGKSGWKPVASDQRDLFVPMPGKVLHLRVDLAGHGRKQEITAKFIPGTEETRNARLAVNRAGTILVHAGPNQPFLFVRRVGDDVGSRVATAYGGFPVCLAQGAGAEEVWFIQSGPFGVGCLDTRSMRVEHLQPGGQATEDQGAHAATLGPDGNLWFTDPEGCRIGRIRCVERDGEPAGRVTLFDLGKGQHPEEIVCSKGALLFFTVRGQAVIGSIRAVAARPEDACGVFVGRGPGTTAAGTAQDIPDPAGAGASAPAAAASGTAAKPKRKPSGAQRRRLRREREAQAQADRVLDPPGVPHPSPATGEPSPPKSEAEEATKVPEPQPPLPAEAPARAATAPRAPAPTRPPLQQSLERLAAMWVQVRVDHLEKHVLKRHAAGTRAKASKFADGYSTPAGLAGLLADALDGAEIGRELRVDRDGSFYTTCRQPRVGDWNGAKTDLFTVVTELVWDKRTRSWWHRLVTAFPGQ